MLGIGKELGNTDHPEIIWETHSQKISIWHLIFQNYNFPFIKMS
jgi:hypothetical protein